MVNQLIAAKTYSPIGKPAGSPMVLMIFLLIRQIDRPDKLARVVERTGGIGAIADFHGEIGGDGGWEY
jgi:hypothetical protein